MNLQRVDSDELLRLKRAAAVRSKEEDFLRKQKEEEEQKRHVLHQLKEAYERREEERREKRLELLKKQAEVRAQKKVEQEKIMAHRERKIQEREASWLERANKHIQEIVAKHYDEEERVEEAREEARVKKRAILEHAAVQKVEEKAKLEHTTAKRAAAIEAREAERRQKELARVEVLKAEAHHELQTFIQHPFPVPLKQVLAGRLRPVPTVTELLAAHKDQREGIKELEEMDIPQAAVNRNMSLFSFVRDIQLKAEAERIRPPDPASATKAKGKTIR